MSIRGDQWKEFSEKVLRHIEEYTVPQYGDAPTDQCETWTTDDCLTAVKKYIARSGTNVRAGQDELDMIKMAHYICLAYLKYEKEDAKIEEVWQLKNGILFTNNEFMEVSKDFIERNLSDKTKRIIIEVKNDNN